MKPECTVNSIPFAECAKKEWYLSMRPASPKQTLTIGFEDGAEYKYLGTGKVNAGDPVLIDYGGATSYRFGQVKATEDGITIKRTHALKPLFTFTTDPGKTEIKKNAEAIVGMDRIEDVAGYFGEGPSARNEDKFKPVDHLVNGILNAITVLAYPALAGNDAVKKAKAFLAKEKPVPAFVFGKNFTDRYYGRYFDILRYADNAEVAFTGHYPGWKDTLLSFDFEPAREARSDLEMEWDKNELAYYLYFKDGNAKLEKFFKGNKAYEDMTNELVFRSALSILIRGGFVNLLQAALSTEMPIKGFTDKLTAFADEIGSTECAKLLRGEACATPEAGKKPAAGKKAAAGPAKSTGKPKPATITVLHKGKEIKVNAVQEGKDFKLDGIPVTDLKRLKQTKPGVYEIDYSAPAFAKIAGTVYCDYTIENACTNLAPLFDRLFSSLTRYCFTPVNSELEAWRLQVKEYIDTERNNGTMLFQIQKWPKKIPPYQPEYTKEQSLVLALKLVDRICSFTDEDISQALGALKKTKQTGALLQNQNVVLFEESYFVPSGSANEVEAMHYGIIPKLVIRSPRNGNHKEICFRL